MAQICLSVVLSCLFALLCYKVTCSLFRGVKLLFTRLWHKVAYLLLVRGTKLLIRRIACLLCCITLYIFNLKHVFYLFINYLSCPFAESVRLFFLSPFSLFSLSSSFIYLLFCPFLHFFLLPLAFLSYLSSAFHFICLPLSILSIPSPSHLLAFSFFSL